MTSTVGSEPSIVKTTWPKPSTSPLAKGAPSLFTLNRPPRLFPPIVKVSVDVTTVEESVHVNSESVIHVEKTLIVVRFAASLLVTEKALTLAVPSRIVPAVLTRSVLNVMLWPVLVRVAAPPTVRDAETLIEEARDEVPAMVRLWNVCPEAIAMVPALPVKVTVDVPAEKTDPAPDVSQLPRTVHGPLVTVIVPDTPPVMLTLVAVTADAPAARTPALLTVTDPPRRPSPAVARVVIPLPPWMVSVPVHTRGFDAIVNVAVDAPLLKTTFANSAAFPGRAAKAIVWEDEESKATVAVPVAQFDEVEALLHDPFTFQVSDPNAMYEAAEEIVTLPETTTPPPVDVNPPPDSVRPAFAVIAFDPLARTPPEMVMSPFATRGPRRVRVPALNVTAPKADPVASLRPPVPEKVTVEPVEVNALVDDVSQLPAPIVTVAEAKLRVAGPLEARPLAPKLTVALVSVRLPLQVREPLNVVETPGLTVRLLTTCRTLIVPPDVLTTMVDVPTLNTPRCVSIDATVIVLAFAVKVPVAPRVMPATVMARPLAEVVRMVFPTGLGAVFWMVSVLPTRRAFPAIV